MKPVTLFLGSQDRGLSPFWEEPYLRYFCPSPFFLFGWWKRQDLTAQIGLLLTAFAWIESSAYAADAMARRMPLIGNLPKSSHDFYNLFTMKGILTDHMSYAWGMYWIGVITLLLFLLYPLFERKHYEYAVIEMDL